MSRHQQTDERCQAWEERDAWVRVGSLILGSNWGGGGLTTVIAQEKREMMSETKKKERANQLLSVGEE